MRSERVSFLVGAMLLVSPTFAWAQATAARLDVEASPSCSTRDELIARVAARSPRIRFVNDAAGVPALIARIETGPRGAVIADLTVVEPDGRKFVRRIEAPSCAAATDALALVVAITLDPSVAAADASASPAGETTSPGATAADAQPPAPPTDGAGVETTRPAEAASPAIAATRRLTAAAGATAIVGPAPAAMPGLTLETLAALDRESIWSPAIVLTFAHVWRGDLRETGGTAEFSLDLFGLELCPVRVALLFRLEARACAAGSLGRLAAQGSRTYNPRSVARLFGTAGGTARLALPLGSRIELRARFGAGAALWRDAFEFSNEVFHRVASVTLMGDVGIGVRFP